MSRTAAEDGYMNVLKNVVAPLNGGSRLTGVAEYLVREGLVEYIVRYVMGIPRNVMQTAERNLYTTSVTGPLIFSDDGVVGPKDKPDMKAQLWEASKRLPGAVVGYIAEQIRSQGIKIPKFVSKDFFVFLVCKILGHLAENLINDSLPTDVKAATAVLDALFERQRAIANSKAESEEY